MRQISKTILVFLAVVLLTPGCSNEQRLINNATDFYTKFREAYTAESADFTKYLLDETFFENLGDVREKRRIVREELGDSILNETIAIESAKVLEKWIYSDMVFENAVELRIVLSYGDNMPIAYNDLVYVVNYMGETSIAHMQSIRRDKTE
ncbi:MAG TPA: hypothetical protein PKV16_06945 [Caldisericia bacterium]|nr:hypothetical protein [Caldisericia bacterium]HPF49504.1 hypothetical protein [Caldisericia bacterium]HPI84202.1 hypothetical protein [Caldisericia bacterium]HPQ93503.1 hypothetical protein [Caldisericia bacterium]HRV75491.1 hypothetical protein [Caldisericia bacterium]